ncbi:MAG: hypothetical protein CMO01_16980 [Thalassobius sp.]|nr:hypothetical protein [Thalassovita sp.]
MTQEEIQAIKERLEKSISTLEEQTTALKQDLKTISEFLNKTTPDDDLSKKINAHQQATESQIEANKELIEQIKEVKESEVKEADTSMVSKLEQETLAMLNRMQQKVNAREILSDLYQSQAKKQATQQSDADPIAPTPPETPQPPKTESIEDEAKKIRAEQDMENTVKKFKDQDALNELKKKLGL